MKCIQGFEFPAAHYMSIHSIANCTLTIVMLGQGEADCVRMLDLLNIINGHLAPSASTPYDTGLVDRETNPDDF